MNETSTTILVIEDEEVLRESMADYLEDLDFRVLTAENGLLGLEIFERERPDLVLTDLRMPEVDGMEVLGRAGELAPETPLIVVSGTGRISDSIQAMRLGAWDYILKPVEDMSIISLAVDKALERARLRRENRVYQENLESLVRERTAELEQANTHLTGINARLRRVVESTRRLSVCYDVVGFGSTLLDEFAKHMAASSGSLFLLEDAGLRLLYTLKPGRVRQFIPFPLPEGSILRRVIEEKKLLLIQDIEPEKELKFGGWAGYGDGSVLAFPLPDETGRVIGVITLHSQTPFPFSERDEEIGAILASHSYEVLKTIQTTESLRASESRFRELAEMLPVSVFETDSNFKVTYANRRAFELSGYSAADLSKGLNILDMLVPEDRERAKANIAMRLKGENPATDEYHALKKDGSTYPILYHASYIMKEGELFGLRGIIIDLTERKQAERAQAKLEEQLRQSQKLESIGQLAGGIAHDFNNLLVPIIGYAELSQMELSPDSRLYIDLQKIRKAAKRAADLTRQILAFSRRQVLEVRVFDLNTVITAFQEMLQRLIGEDIKVQILLASTPCQVKADRSQIEQILLNLSINARDAMPNGGKLVVETDNVFLDEGYVQKHSETQPGSYVMLAISDTGHGMDTETQKRIFEPFFTTKETGKGTGLGLAMVFGLVKQHQGNIWVYSEPDQGTTFKIYLPQSEEIAQTAGAAISEPTSVSGVETVLIVEDEPIVRKLVCETLEAYGYNVLEAESPGKGLQIVATYKRVIHLLLTDVIMPDMNGRELYEKLVIIRPDLKVLYMSGYTDNVIVHHGVLNEGVNLLQKPFTVRGLAQKVRKVLDLS